MNQETSERAFFADWQLQLPVLLCECVGMEDGRFTMTQPFRQGDWVYATNGKIAVRCPWREHYIVPPRGHLKYPPVPTLFGMKEQEGLGVPSPVPYVPPRYGVIGEDEDGEDIIGEIVTGIEFRNAKGERYGLSSLYLRVIWPWAKTIYIPDKSTPCPAYFEAGDVQGLLMPIALRNDPAVPATDLMLYDREPAR